MRCIKCAICCHRGCLDYPMDESGAMWTHDYALRLMDSMFSEYYEHKKRSDGDTTRIIFEQFKKEVNEDGINWFMTCLPELMKMIANMMEHKKGYWQNNKWRKFGVE